jgi:prepilin peptidase CpaA
MGESTALSFPVLLITCGVLFYAALTDLREFTIPNRFIVVLAALFFLDAAVTGHWGDMVRHTGFALAISVVTVVLYARRYMGGGDVKLFAVALLWVGVESALTFAVLLLVCTTAHAAAAKIGWAATRRDDDQCGSRIPLAPSVATALIATFMLTRLFETPAHDAAVQAILQIGTAS